MKVYDGYWYEVLFYCSDVEYFVGIVGFVMDVVVLG